MGEHAASNLAEYGPYVLGLRDDGPADLLTVANLIAAWMDRSTRRKWWLGAAVIVLLERIATFS